MTRANGQLTLTWDGPYDIDGQKVRITLFADGRQIGDRIEVKRGVQTAAIPGIEPGKEYSIQFQSVDLSGNVSKGITVESKEQPVYSLTVGGHALKDGDSFTDDAVLTFRRETVCRQAVPLRLVWTAKRIRSIPIPQTSPSDWPVNWAIGRRR
ncbi:hypothetical protein CM49_05183 [Paenibacillus sp. P1XP2]|nr:hypothetical protein CM49_05183 [Paenibacillus sp. P1XP2]